MSPRQQKAIPPPITLNQEDVVWLELGQQLRQVAPQLYRSMQRTIRDAIFFYDRCAREVRDAEMLRRAAAGEPDVEPPSDDEE